MITKSFTTENQLDAKGEVIDKIFHIDTVQTYEVKEQERYSGTEVKEKIKDLEKEEKKAEKALLKVQDELNFYKGLK